MAVCDGLPENVRLGTERPLPKAVADDRYGVLASGVVLPGEETTTVRRCQSKNAEVVRRDDFPVQSLGFVRESPRRYPRRPYYRKL